MTKPDRRAACVACGKPVTPENSPFCSQGCKDRDLLQWLSDGYRIPGPAISDDDADEGGGGTGVVGLDSDDDAT